LIQGYGFVYIQGGDFVKFAWQERLILGEKITLGRFEQEYITATLLPAMPIPVCVMGYQRGCVRAVPLTCDNPVHISWLHWSPPINAFGLDYAIGVS